MHMNIFKKIIPFATLFLVVSCSSNGEPSDVKVSGVSINYRAYEVEVDGSFQLESTIYPENATNQNVTWEVTSGKSYARVTEFGEVVALKAGNATVTVTTEDGGYKANCNVSVKAKPEPISAEDFTLYKSTSLTIGSYVTFTNGSSGYSIRAISSQRDRNRGTTSASVSNEILSPGNSVAIFKVEEGTVTGSYAFFEESTSSYIYAASSSSNDLKSSSTKTDNSSFKIISNSDGAVVLVAQGENTRNYLRYNTRNQIFSCYASDSQVDAKPYLFVKSGEPIYPTDFEIDGPSELAVNEQTTLSLSFEPENTNQKVVSWSSSNLTIASVSAGGIVTGLSEGQATIYASVLKEDGDKITRSHFIKVKTIPVTGVTLNASSVELSKGKTYQIEATVSPSNASNKELEYSSSNTSVATVSATGLVTVGASVAAGKTATITVKTKDGGFTATLKVTTVEAPSNDWTILIYMCGADLESENALATSDLQEILSVNNQPSDVNIVIETGGAKSWSSTYSINASKLQRHHVSNKKLVTDASLTYASMGLASTLQSFVEYGLKSYPADKTGLILWNHGGGLQGVCYDEKSNDDSLLDYEVVSAVSNALNSTGNKGKKLEFIGYDACLMQLQDIAEMNSSYFNYMIASEESESGYGWDYDSWVDDLYAKKDTTTILKAIVDGFIADNGGTSSSRNDQTLSYLNLSKMSAYKTAFEKMAAQLKSKITTSNKSSFNSLVKSCKYYADSDYTYFGLFDAKDFLNKLSSNSTFNPGETYISDALTAFSDLVAYESHGKGAGNSNGLCLYWAVNSNTTYYNTYTSSTTNFSNWMSVVNTYGGSGY